MSCGVTECHVCSHWSLDFDSLYVEIVVALLLFLQDKVLNYDTHKLIRKYCCVRELFVRRSVAYIPHAPSIYPCVTSWFAIIRSTPFAFITQPRSEQN